MDQHQLRLGRRHESDGHRVPGRAYGDVYVDLDRKVAVGLDGCIVRAMQVERNGVSIELEDRVNRSTPLLLKMRHVAFNSCSLRINGGAPQEDSRQELLAGVRIPIAALVQ